MVYEEARGVITFMQNAEPWWNRPAFLFPRESVNLKPTMFAIYCFLQVTVSLSVASAIPLDAFISKIHIVRRSFVPHSLQIIQMLPPSLVTVKYAARAGSLSKRFMHGAHTRNS